MGDPAYTIGGIVMIAVTLPIGILYMINRKDWMNSIAASRHY